MAGLVLVRGWAGLSSSPSLKLSSSPGLLALIVTIVLGGLFARPCSAQPEGALESIQDSLAKQDDERLLKALDSLPKGPQVDLRPWVELLERALTHEDPRLRRLAALGLARLGLGAESAEEALRALGEIGILVSEETREVIRDLSHQDPLWQIRLAALETLDLLPQDFVSGFLRGARLRDRDLRVCVAAAKSMRAEQTSGAAVHALGDSRREVRLLARWVLHGVDPDRLPRAEALAALRSPYRARRIRAAWAHTQVPRWLAQLPRDWRVKVAPKDRAFPVAFSELLPSLIRGAFGPSPARNRERCRAALFELGLLSRVASPWLLLEARSEDPALRWRALETLAKIGASPRVVIPLMAAVVHAPKASWRRAPPQP